MVGRGKVGHQIGVDQLKQSFRLGEVLQPVGPQVAQSRLLWQGLLDERCCRTGQEDLAAMAGRHDPGSPIDGRTVEVAAAVVGLSCVHAHANAKRTGLGPGLRR